jgi:hypothetical protein
MGFLACVADEVARAGGARAEPLRLAAVEAGYGSRTGRLTHLESVHYLVERAFRKLRGHDLSVADTDHRLFAQNYLYPNRAKWARVVQSLLGIPEAVERLIG